MTSVLDKLDAGLASIYIDYLHAQETGFAPRHAHDAVVEQKELRVTLFYSGDLAPIEALGFRTVWAGLPGRANGAIDLPDIERLAAHPGVLKLSFGGKPQMFLDKSVPDIRVRDTVWTLSGSTFSGTTGKDVIIGIIDSGIDWEHPYFRKTDTPKTTRILRIWDPGLHKEGTEKEPPASRLTNPPYGVEYTQEQIIAALGGAFDIRHRDCGGHGTHVASIAAGDGRDSHKFVGVAPEASLIIVKFFDLANDPPVNPHAFLLDCITYILKTAEEEFPGNKGVVINCSFGNDIGPHDGFTEDEDMLTFLFDPAHAGRVLVNAAGNSGNKSQHARIEFSASDKVATIPFTVFDGRTKREEYDSCDWADPTHALKLDVFYPDDGTPPLKFELDLPDDDQGFFEAAAFGGTKDGDYGPTRRYKTFHKQENGELTSTGRGTVKRRHFQLELGMNDKQEHRLSKHDFDYQIKITAEGPIQAHVWCQNRGSWGMSLNSLADDGSFVFINEKRFHIGDNAGAKNIITVANYTAEQTDLALARGSSRGPLASYDSSAPAQPAKPDIAAPGVDIDAAHSHFVRPRQRCTETVQLGGTSMAAPHVAGVVALMLQKKSTLNVDDILKIFKDHPRTGDAFATVLDPEEGGFGRIDGNLAVTNVP